MSSPSAATTADEHQSAPILHLLAPTTSPGVTGTWRQLRPGSEEETTGSGVLASPEKTRLLGLVISYVGHVDLMDLHLLLRLVKLVVHC
jgi:hypothetical protein